MGLRDSIEYIRHREKELRLFNVGSTERIDEELRAYFETLNVRITVSRTTSGKPEGVAVLSNATEVLALVDVASLRELLEDAPTGAGQFGITDGEYGDFLRHLKETSFTSYDTEQLLYASREIEDRARRVGQGTIHAGFQQCSVMAEQRSVYTDLTRRGVAVHAYGVPDATPPDLGSGHVHAVSTAEIAETWFVVFDGGGDDTQKTALIARESDDIGFYGVWTYDPGFANLTLAHLDQTYGSATDDMLSGP
ncbi:Diguanylate Cyclase and Two-component system sensory domain-containing protein [Halorientalis regularis]|uniref:Diguanylate Cyclase and Two-component system sensory domain-containing protein n=2 Tax=Halorientalis regularis TaxID=660518 RepID=A0A1G7NHN7_9EURY|nr:Diguanylate Cyclase and Two-component system sensory domain-containing protein [Halorientalis regularis]